MKLSTNTSTAIQVNDEPCRDRLDILDKNSGILLCKHDCLNEQYLLHENSQGKVAIITGGDSGIGRAIAFAMEGADVAIMYNESDEDAQTTRKLLEDRGGRCLVIKCDVRFLDQCRAAVGQTVEQLGGLNILVNNAAYEVTQDRFEDITEEQFRRTFETNSFGYFYMAQAALPHLSEGYAIINTGSTTALVGNPMLVDCGRPSSPRPRPRRVSPTRAR